MSDNKNAVNLLRAQYKQSSEWLMGTMEGMTEEALYFQPPGGGAISPIAGQVGHLVTGLDFFLLGSTTDSDALYVTSFAGKAGISEPPPQGGDWAEWGRNVEVDLSQLHGYAEAVFAAVDAYLASVDDSELEREIEFPFGTFSVQWVFNTMLLNTYSHVGEISVLKGIQGLKGYPM